MTGRLIAELRERADSYRQSGPSAEHTAMLLDFAANGLEHDERVIAGLNAQLTEQFGLSTKYTGLTLHLLEVLREIHNGMAASRDDIMVDDWIELARTAIAKAEGRS